MINGKITLSSEDEIYSSSRLEKSLQYMNSTVTAKIPFRLSLLGTVRTLIRFQILLLVWMLIVFSLGTRKGGALRIFDSHDCSELLFLLFPLVESYG